MINLFISKWFQIATHIGFGIRCWFSSKQIVRSHVVLYMFLIKTTGGIAQEAFKLSLGLILFYFILYFLVVCDCIHSLFWVPVSMLMHFHM